MSEFLNETLVQLHELPHYDGPGSVDLNAVSRIVCRLDTRDADLTEALRLLREGQWVAGALSLYCAECFNTPDEGHTSDCKRGAFLQRFPEVSA